MLTPRTETVIQVVEWLEHWHRSPDIHDVLHSRTLAEMAILAETRDVLADMVYPDIEGKSDSIRKMHRNMAVSNIDQAIRTLAYTFPSKPGVFSANIAMDALGDVRGEPDKDVKHWKHGHFAAVTHVVIDCPVCGQKVANVGAPRGLLWNKDKSVHEHSNMQEVDGPDKKVEPAGLDTSTKPGQIVAFAARRPKYDKDHIGNLADNADRIGIPFCRECADWHYEGDEHSDDAFMI